LLIGLNLVIVLFYIIIRLHLKYNGGTNNIYHLCPEDKTQSKTKEYLDGLRYIFIDMKHDPSLLLEGEWPWYIEDDKCTQCTCEVKSYALKNTKDIPHIYNYAVPNIKKFI
jgi:hypothetical protein